MMKACLNLLDRLAGVLSGVACAALVMLIGVCLWEVLSRYALNAPTVWSADMINFANSGLFVLGLAYAQREGAHVAIDIFSNKMPARIRAVLIGGLMLCLVLPVLAVLCWEATMTLVRMYSTGRVIESAWHPVRWPFYVPMALGLWAFWLQSLASTLRMVLRLSEPPAPIVTA
jgi:TRAP-type C4-dicarboxylate transport system permease small subunit